VISATEGDTKLMLKQLTPVRLMKNRFSEAVAEAEQRGASIPELEQLLGRARAKKGMFEGDLDEGELEIGQVAAIVRDIKPAGEIVRDIWTEFQQAGEQLCSEMLRYRS
jgi:enoyl-[acyl-carrier protein] reductase II